MIAAASYFGSTTAPSNRSGQSTQGDHAGVDEVLDTAYFEYRGKDGNVHGPYGASQMRQWVELVSIALCMYLSHGALLSALRRVGAFSQVGYHSPRILHVRRQIFLGAVRLYTRGFCRCLNEYSFRGDAPTRGNLRSFLHCGNVQTLLSSKLRHAQCLPRLAHECTYVTYTAEVHSRKKPHESMGSRVSASH